MTNKQHALLMTLYYIELENAQLFHVRFDMESSDSLKTIKQRTDRFFFEIFNKA